MQRWVRWARGSVPPPSDRRDVQRRRRSSDGSTDGDARALPDGGEGTFPRGDEAEQTAFRWGPDREEDDEGSEDLAELERRLAEVEDLAEAFRVHAMNVQVKLARDEPEALQSVGYDLEAAANRLQRTVGRIETRLDRLGASDDADGENVAFSDDEDGERAERSGDPGGESPVGQSATATDGRGSSPRQPGPTSVAGVDLARWPGHLADVDFEQFRRRVPSTATATGGGVPDEVARFALGDDELTFEEVLGLAREDPSLRGRWGDVGESADGDAQADDDS